jgi:hypothetical protein
MRPLVLVAPVAETNIFHVTCGHLACELHASMWLVVGEGRHYLVCEAAQALAGACTTHDHVLDSNSTQGIQFPHNLLWCPDQTVGFCVLRRMTIGKDV